MTLLHHEALLQALQEPRIADRLVVTPLLDPEQVGEGSIDLRLGTEFLVLRRTLRSGLDPNEEDLDLRIRETQDRVRVPLGKGLWLHPQQFILGSTLEFLGVPPTMGGYVVGRSSWGRLGLLVATAVMVQPGFTGCLTLELVNAGDSPIRLYPGLRIAQLALHSLPSPTDFGYSGRGQKYIAPTGPQESRVSKERPEIAKLDQLGKALTRP